MKYSTLAPRGGTPITDLARLEYLSAHLHTYDDYGVDNVGVCLGTLKDDEAGAYILTRSATQTWAWYFEDAEQAAAAFRHFGASPFSDWAYAVADSGLLPLIAQHGLLPQLQLESLPAGLIRFYRSPEDHQNPQTPVLLRVPWPDEAKIDPDSAIETNDDGQMRHEVWFTASLPLPVEIDLHVGDGWMPIEEFARSLEAANELSRLADSLAASDSPSL